MNKLIAIIICCTAVRCSPVATQTKAVYDEAALKQFVLTTAHSSTSKNTKALDTLLQHSASDSTVFLHTITYLEEPFGGPNSAYRNDSLYAVVLQAKAGSPWIDSIFQRRASERLRLLQQNQSGTIANDFTYQTPSGYKKTLHDLKSKYTLLFFYNPECAACKEMKAALASSEQINKEIANKQLQVLAVYTDKDESVWLKHLDEMPKNWIHGRDQDEYLYNNNIYDLRAIPTTYLLDSDKIVLLKDCTSVAEIESAIGNH